MSEITPRRGPNPGAVLGGLVLVALGAAVAVHELFGLSWDWKYWAAGILLLGGAAVATGSVVSAALRGADRERPR
ncbi:hypothetical protein [Kineococcus sp. SYSU DK001]|uniref:hypothetical protein n=1 Tax=Kineococcus sp. SYSU DK001 TaxID=3383122 RepID=UPI003D7EC194